MQDPENWTLVNHEKMYQSPIGESPISVKSPIALKLKENNAHERHNMSGIRGRIFLECPSACEACNYTT